MTQSIDERAKINTSRSVAAMIAIGVINIITVPLVTRFGSSDAKNGYLAVAVIYGCIFTACHFFCFAKTREVVAIPEKEKISLKVQLKAILQNRPYLLALAGISMLALCLFRVKENPIKSATMRSWRNWRRAGTAHKNRNLILQDGGVVVHITKGEFWSDNNR